MDKLDNQKIITRLQDRYGEGLAVIGEPHGLLTVAVNVETIIDVLQFVKEDPELRMNYLTDITAVHYPRQEQEFCVVYHVYNMLQDVRLRIKVFVSGPIPTVPTATTIWHGANWMERETYDFFGIIFEGHPDLRRILNMDELDVFPMRKEYPLEDPNRVDKKDFYFGR
ncbi:NADH dehydrogenase subunit C [Sphingobacterium allocomposti]|jgi:NADH-quinone oxidoreductase subunit C|uniref:NADH-quinone oxidoreductase subunit C n=1 Tax=Sphingobacterium allocomposti TaxID=415956 RepID=A0A5S5DFE2_9SPHI|nr:NADH-quinone oxidoreductase subunit C [Sphingobacterium composti Yoo et al. 2007 non Ten et al. 2007]TYP94677.1 NADH dehydrogenase subunit C [Sphingobacterium composti Yoo et al. 2007 non Ten et al. 2007]HLS94342.1 NADH-quinone oxidoreductase subunit C [Sphingobacterium sp.]